MGGELEPRGAIGSGGSGSKCEKQERAERERDSVSLLSRVFDVLTVTC